MKMEKRNKGIFIRLTADELKMINDKSAKTSYKNRSELLRRAVLSFSTEAEGNRFQTIKQLGDELKEATYHLNKIGNNVNQIAHTLNVDRLNHFPRLESSRESVYQSVSDSMQEVISSINGIKVLEQRIYKKIL